LGTLWACSSEQLLGLLSVLLMALRSGQPTVRLSDELRDLLWVWQ